ncbi:MAG: hypothetical protein WCF68_04280, partial [Terriglobales bacterium]
PPAPATTDTTAPATPPAATTTDTGKSDNKNPPAGQNPDNTEKKKPEATAAHQPEILSWLIEDEENLPFKNKLAYGGLLFLLGAVGAMITAFYSIGDALPGIGGSGLVEPQEARMAALENAVKTTETNLAEIQEKLKTGDANANANVDPRFVDNLKYVGSQYIDEIKLYEKHAARLRDLVNNNKWRIWSYGMPMYIIIGGATSMLFARDWMQALLFGASWAGVFSTIGLKGTVSQKSLAAANQEDKARAEIQKIRDASQLERKALEQNSATLHAMLALAVEQIKQKPPQPPPQPAVP